MAGIYQSSRSATSHSTFVLPLRISIISPSPSTGVSPVGSTATPLVLSKPRISNRYKTDAARIFATLLQAHKNAPPVQRPIIIRDVSPHVWEVFRDTYGEHHSFKASKWDYENMKIIAVPLPMPFHDLAPNIMNEHVYFELRDAGIDTRARVMSLKVNRENLAKHTASGISGREPDCALWTRQYQRGVVPTIVWEVGHSQKRSSLLRRAKMWCRRYNGQVRVVILLKYLRRNPLTDNSSILEVYRPMRRIDGKWTAAKDGPTYTLFPAPPNANEPLDAVPLTYQDYFGPGNTAGAHIDPDRRFDLPLSLVRRWVQEMVAVTVERFAYRYVSGGSSVGGEVQNPGGGVVAPDVVVVEQEVVMDDGRATPELVEYEEFGDEWDAAMSDVSDDA